MIPLKALFIVVFTSTFFCIGSVIHAQDVMLRDFSKKSFNYGYEGWVVIGEFIEKTPTGVHIQGPAKGGAGAYFSEIQDVSTQADLEVKIKRGVENTETKLLLKLIAADTKSYTFDIPLAEVSDAEFTTVKLSLAPAREKINLEEIKQMQLQGTFTPGAKVDVEIESIAATGTATTK